MLVQKTAGARIIGLDALRALLLSYGVFVHTANINIGPVFEYIELTSALFRMSCFFFLAGLLAALTMDRLTPFEWVKGRLVTLVVPLLFGLVIINPAFFALHSVAPHVGFMAGFMERNRFVTPLHLWFLIPLIVYSVIAYVIRVIEIRLFPDQRFEKGHVMPVEPRYQATAFVAIIALCLAPPALNWLIYQIPFHGFGLDNHRFVWASTARYAPYFLLGFFLTRSSTLRSAFSSKIYGLVLALMSIPGVLSSLQIAEQKDIIYEFPIVLGISKAAFAFFFIVTITPWFYRFKHVSKPVLLLSQASYTLYIMHFIMISICLICFANLRVPMYTAAAATVAIVFTGCLLIHFGLVERFRWVRFALNGRFSQSVRPASAISQANLREVSR